MFSVQPGGPEVTRMGRAVPVAWVAGRFIKHHVDSRRPTPELKAHTNWVAPEELKVNDYT